MFINSVSTWWLFTCEKLQYKKNEELQYTTKKKTIEIYNMKSNNIGL